MEKSMKRVEKLVHATNSALAQMKFSMMFDDSLMGGEKTFRRAEACQPRFCLDGKELKQCQDEFSAEANEMLTKMDKMFGSTELSRKNWKALDRIKEINRKMNAYRQDHSKLRGTEQSSEKLVSLLAEEKLSPQKTSSKNSLRAKPPSPCKRETEPLEKHHRAPKKSHSLLLGFQSPAKSKDELKSNILETREVVDRGFHAARHLALKVENMTRNDRKEKRPSLEGAVSETNLRSLDERSESNETIKSGKHGRRSGREEKKSGDSVGEGQRSNARVVDVKRRDCQRRRRSNLKVQRLPSVDIRGRLQLQKIHSLDIPAGGDIGCGKANTGIHILSHEQIERAKMEKILNEVKKENWCCSEVRGNAYGNCVECTNCGKVMRVQETWVNPRRVDEILRKCRFNVFDPRIDEFVEKYAAADAWKWCEKSESVGAYGGEAEIRTDGEEKTEAKRAAEQPKVVKGFSLEDLSKRLSSKYRQEAEELEGHHLRLNNLLQNLFRKIDESREIFEECHLFRNKKSECERVLTTTEPIVVSLTRRSIGSRRKQKLDKRDVKNRSKSRTGEWEVKASAGTEGVRTRVLGDNVRRKRNVEGKARGYNEGRLMPVWPDESLVDERTGSRREAAEEEQKAPCPAPPCSDRSWSYSQPEVAFGRANTEELSMMSDQGNTTELRMSKSGKGDSAKRSELKVEGTKEAEEEGVTSASSSVSSSSEKQGLGAYMIERNTNLEASVKGKGQEMAQVTVSVTSGGKALSEVSTERSENNYESDFESLTNEPEEGGGECEDAEPEVIPCGKKLSTISEVDSELERKLSEEQKTQRSNPNSAGLPDGPKLSEEGTLWNQLQSSLEVKGKKSTSLTPEISRETSKAENIPSLKSTPTELVTSLKEILSALKDQFSRTETLAEKLTENVKLDKSERAEVPSRQYGPTKDGMPTPWEIPVERLVENLLSARKNLAEVAKPGSTRSQKCQDGMSTDSLSDEGGSSLGEVVVGGKRKGETSFGLESSFLKLGGSQRSSWLSSARKEKTKISSGSKLNANNEEVSYSEGEIPGNLMLDSECCSSRSVGEIGH